jgi:hypothetical protein
VGRRADEVIGQPAVDGIRGRADREPLRALRPAGRRDDRLGGVAQRRADLRWDQGQLPAGGDERLVDEPPPLVGGRRPPIDIEDADRGADRVDRSRGCRAAQLGGEGRDGHVEARGRREVEPLADVEPERGQQRVGHVGRALDEREVSAGCHARAQVSPLRSSDPRRWGAAPTSRGTREPWPAGSMRGGPPRRAAPRRA